MSKTLPLPSPPLSLSPPLLFLPPGWLYQHNSALYSLGCPFYAVVYWSWLASSSVSCGLFCPFLGDLHIPTGMDTLPSESYVQHLCELLRMERTSQGTVGYNTGCRTSETESYTVITSILITKWWLGYWFSLVQYESPKNTACLNVKSVVICNWSWWMAKWSFVSSNVLGLIWLG